MTEVKKPKLYTPAEAAQLVEGLTEWRVKVMCRSGQLKCFKAGNRYLITEKSLYEAVGLTPDIIHNS